MVTLLAAVCQMAAAHASAFHLRQYVVMLVSVCVLVMHIMEGLGLSGTCGCVRV